METRLSRICGAIIEAGWLLAVIVTPLFFNTYSSRVFEPDKLHLLRSIAVLMAVAWLVELLDGSWRRGLAGMSLWQRLRSTPLMLPALALCLAYIISTLFSVVPGISFFGSYVRLQGTYSFFSYVAIFAMVLTHLRTRAQLNRLLHAIILTSIPISIYGMLQHYGLDPLPWGGDVQDRVAANMGNAIFVAAYLIMAFFLTVERLINSITAILTEDRTADVVRTLVYMFVLGLQVITIIFTQSRGPWLGWAAGIYVFVILGLRLLGRWAQNNQRAPRWLPGTVRPAYLGLIALSLISIALLVVMNLPQSPLAGLRKVRYVGRMGTLMSMTEGTNAVRVLIWEGVVDMMLKPHAPIQYPPGTPTPWWAPGGGPTGTAAINDGLNSLRWLIGYGPESMWVAYNRFYPPDLAHYELRNASPDRSHNETFDALVRTGFLGLAAQLALFASVFYYALRWLGLVGSRGRRNLFLGLLAIGAALGVLIPWVVDHSLRLAGLGLPSGMILGLIVYVTLDLLLPSPVKAEDRTDGAEAGSAQRAAVTGRQELLLLALFAALVAHFGEIHFGIAIASTLTHFWVLAGVLVVSGMGWLRDEEAPAATPAVAEPDRREREREAVQALPATERVGVRQETVRAVPAAAATATRSAKGKRNGAARGDMGRTSARDRRPASVERAAPVRSEEPGSLRVFLPYALIGGIVTLVLVWNYAINQQGLHGAFNILWSAFTTRISGRVSVGSPWLLMLVLLTWLLGGALALTEAARSRNWRLRPFRYGSNTTIYAGVVLAVFLIYGAWQASLTDISNFSGMEVFKHILSYLNLFDFMLLLMGLGLAGALARADLRPRPARWFGINPAISLSAGVIAAVLALIAIVAVNVQIVQADVYYKQGFAYEEAGQWEGAIIMYDQAAQMEPKEDYYYLFLGRSLLEYAALVQPGNATLPTDLAKVETGNLLRVAESALNSRTREDLMRAAYAVLTGAQRLNPLNTDHTANLARLFRSWAFARATSAEQAPNNSTLRQIVEQHPDQVDKAHLDRSLAYYQQATALSPHNAQLWNEQASVRYVNGDTPGALADLNTSAGLDRLFYQTYLLQGDMLADSGDKQGAVTAYRHAAELRPNDMQILGAVGVYSAQAGDLQGALDAFKKITDSETTALNSAQAALADLDAQATRAGGYQKLGGDADQRRQQLQSNIDGHRNQLQMTYRNEALVLRDANRIPEALTAAQAALGYASADQRPALEQLIAELQKR